MAMKDILIGEKRYKVDTLSVLDSIDFQIEFTKGLGGLIGKLGAAWATAQNGKEVSKDFLDTLFNGLNVETIKPLKKTIFKQIITPENKYLADEAYLQEWFSREENKEDVWTVLQMGAVTLLGEYTPKFLKEMMKAGQERISVMQNQYKSQKSTAKKQ